MPSIDTAWSFSVVSGPSIFAMLLQARARASSPCAAAWNPRAVGSAVSRSRASSNSDITHVGRIAAHEGIGTVLRGLSDSVRFDGRNLEVRLSSPIARDRPVSGEGVTLVPSIFFVRASTPIDDDLPPTIMCPARGQGAVWSTTSHPDQGAVRDLLGVTWAALLQELGEPASSTDLALRFGVSTSGTRSPG